MTPEELAKLCVKAINSSGSITPRITLKLPESKRASKKRYPWGRKGPAGTVVAWGFDGYDMVIFDALDLLAFLTANGVVKIKGLE